MADFVRRIVSGNKARFKDSQLNMELDLVYLTDQVLIMGFPAAGFEGLYRNKREDTKKFLEHRHGKNYWIYNFCPVKENSYDKEFFEGRVSRYPFPDHHAPPLAIMPLLARDMTAWLSGSKERVAVLHCKAGKGRSGTMACTYLLTLDDTPQPPQLQRSYDPKEWAKHRAEILADEVPDHEQESVQATETPAPDLAGISESSTMDALVTESPQTMTPQSTRASTIVVSETSNTRQLTGTLKDVLDLHTSRRMKADESATPEEKAKAKQGVSIPSQRRWLYYWSLLLAGQAPLDILPYTPQTIARKQTKVRLTDIKLRMKETGGMKMHLVKAVNGVFDKTGMGKSGAAEAMSSNGHHVWVSLARYDDDFVNALQKAERVTRDTQPGASMGRQKSGTDSGLRDEFEDGKWDKGKMVKSFARMGCLDDDSVQKDETAKEKSYHLRPLSDASWQQVKDDIKEDDSEKKRGHGELEAADIPGSEVNSMHDITSASSSPERGIVLDASREVRIKFYMGQVFIGWIWIIPSFHMPHASTEGPVPPPTTRLLLTRKEVDFPLGVGANIIDVEIGLTWVTENEAEIVHPPSQTSLEVEPKGLPATLQAGTESSVGGAVHAKQAAED